MYEGTLWSLCMLQKLTFSISPNTLFNNQDLIYKYIYIWEYIYSGGVVSQTWVIPNLFFSILIFVGPEKIRPEHTNMALIPLFGFPLSPPNRVFCSPVGHAPNLNVQSFLMEFVDAQRVANNSPPCTFTPDPPLEVRSMPTPAGQRPVGYLSFGTTFFDTFFSVTLCSVVFYLFVLLFFSSSLFFSVGCV